MRGVPGTSSSSGSRVAEPETAAAGEALPGTAAAAADTERVFRRGGARVRGTTGARAIREAGDGGGAPRRMAVNLACMHAMDAIVC